MQNTNNKEQVIRTTVFLLIIVFAMTWSAQADVLLIDRVEAKAGTNMPQKSATMTQVRAQFGDPVSERAAVGEPPITRWEYNDFIVYFEHQYVITTVLKKSKPTEIGPEPIDPTDG